MIRSPPHSLRHTRTAAAAAVLRRYVHRRPRARRGGLCAGGLEWFCLPSGVLGFHECNRFRHRQAGEAKQVGYGDRYEVCSEATSGWTRRILVSVEYKNRSQFCGKSGHWGVRKFMVPGARVEFSLRANLPIEMHVNNVCTRVIFDQFDEALYKVVAYVLNELELNICLHLDLKCLSARNVQRLIS